MWNDTDVPLAYLITFRAYGTWLHGDERGSVDRFNNKYDSPFIAANQNWQRHNKQLTKGEAVFLNDIRRQSVENAVRETCEHRRWHLRAINARTNHIHVVVTAATAKPETVLSAFKAYATRKMRENKCWRHDHSPWASGGSKLRLWNERSIERAIEYVAGGQGDELPNFDN